MASGRAREERDIKLEFCPQAGEKNGCLQYNCLRLHLCPFFIKDKCTYGTKCRRSHNLSDEHTCRVLDHFRLGYLLNDRSNHRLTKLLSQVADESEIQLTAASRSVPDICKFYNKGVCKKGPNCPCLHICEHFVDGDCKFGKNCKREHSLSDDHNKRVLKSYSIREVHLLQYLKGRERKRTVSEGSDVERPISAKPKSAMSDITPALSQGLAFDSKEKDCEICGFNLRGKCNYGDRCVNRHTELPYLWEFSVNDGDKWKSFSSDLNTMLEEAYCDVDNDGYKVQVGGNSCNVQFQDMTAVPIRGVGHKRFKVRRLSTVSSVVAPAGHIFSTRWNWYWQDENQKWQSYDSPDDGHAFNTTSSQCLEKEYVEGKESHPFSASNHHYTLYFKKMCQRNDVYKTKRSVRRRPTDLVTKENMKEIAQKRRAAVLGRQMVASAGSGSSDGRPTHWTPMPDGIDYKRVPLPSISEGYKKAEKKFLETMEGHPNIVSIEQVQNIDLWTLYIQRKSHLAKKSGKQPEERQLFHGTDASTVEAISQQGFDWRMCGKHGTLYGKGTYFACKANYSHRYTQPGSGCKKMMFLARVLVGSFTNGGREMIRPPAKDPLNPHVLYDSCCDNSSNPALFVIFENGQSYPEFLITYT